MYKTNIKIEAVYNVLAKKYILYKKELKDKVLQ